jgi:hypothetical protein
LVGIDSSSPPTVNPLEYARASVIVTLVGIDSSSPTMNPLEYARASVISRIFSPRRRGGRYDPRECLPIILRLPTRHREGQEPWPGDAIPTGHPLAGQWQQEWEVLGFFSGPPLLSLLRASLPAGLADTRSLLGLVGKNARLAGLVLSGGESGAERVLLEDEWGTVEAALPQQEGEPAPLGVTAVLEGRVEERHGQPLLVAGEEGNVTDGTLQPRQGAGGNGLAKAR